MMSDWESIEALIAGTWMPKRGEWVLYRSNDDSVREVVLFCNFHPVEQERGIISTEDGIVEVKLHHLSPLRKGDIKELK